jgi:hypothetical protein
LTHSFDTYGEDESWDAEIRYDDQTFPQQVIDLARVCEKRGRKYNALRNELNSGPTVSFLHYSAEKHAGLVRKLFAQQQIEGYYDAHAMYLNLETTEDRWSFVFFVDDTLVGFSVLDRISPVCVAYNALACDISMRFLATSITHEICVFSYEQGFEFLNMQGSETAGLDRWKRKFVPSKSIKRVHMLYCS